MTKEEIEKLEPSKERVDMQLDELGVTSKIQRDCFHKGVMFAKGYLKKDIDLLERYRGNNGIIPEQFAG